MHYVLIIVSLYILHCLVKPSKKSISLGYKDSLPHENAHVRTKNISFKNAYLMGDMHSSVLRLPF